MHTYVPVYNTHAYIITLSCMLMCMRIHTYTGVYGSTSKQLQNDVAKVHR